MPRQTKGPPCQECVAAGAKRPRTAVANKLCNAHNMRKAKGWQVAGPIRELRRLTPEEAQRIRHRYVSPEAPTVLELAQEHGVSRVTIWRTLRALRHASDDGLQERIDQRSRENEHPSSPRSTTGREARRR